RIRVAGLLATKDRHSGRLVQKHEILGTPDEVASILRNLEVHGVCADRIVVTVAFSTLSASARSALLDVERNSDIRVEFFADNIGIVGRSEPATKIGSAVELESMDEFSSNTVDAEVGLYRYLKRVIDIVVAMSALVLLGPAILLLAVFVAIDV